MWEPRRLTAVMASTACYRNSLFLYAHYDHWVGSLTLVLLNDLLHPDPYLRTIYSSSQKGTDNGQLPNPPNSPEVTFILTEESQSFPQCLRML
jgi:hypothetical protein